MGKKRSSHLKALEKIAAKPSAFGFKDIVYSAIEVNLFNRTGVIAQPDVVLIAKDGTVHLIEYKGNGSESELQRAHSQLEKAVAWYARYTNVSLDQIKTRVISGTSSRYRDLFRK
jgi:hypothetical protein